jgi:mercuric ion binding protein
MKMKFTTSMLTILFTSLLFVGCKDKTSQTDSDSGKDISTPHVKKEIAASNLQTASFTIKGMTCAIGCAKTIQEELNGLEGVKIAAVNFEEESATVSFDKTILSPAALTKVVEAAADGKTYTVSNMK